MYKRILAPVDCSESSLNALREAARLARGEGADLFVINVVPPYAGDVEFVIGGVMEEMDASCRKVVEQVSVIAREEGLPVDTTVEEGEPSEVILEVAGEGGFDLIVMGRRGLRRLEYALIGSTTKQVVSHARMDVLVMPRATRVDCRRVMLAMDAVPRSPEAVVRAMHLARNVGELLIVYAAEPAGDSLGRGKTSVEEVRIRAVAEGVNAEGFVKEGSPYEVITAVAKEREITLIVLGRRVGAAIPLFPGGVAEKIIGYSSCPVLVAGKS